MPNWVTKTLSGSLICMFCGSLVSQVLGIWICSDLQCTKYADLPIEEQKGAAGWINPKPVIGTASLASGLSYPIGTIDKGGER